MIPASERSDQSNLVLDLDADQLDDLFLHDAVTGEWFQLISSGTGSFTTVGGGAWTLEWDLYPTDVNGDDPDAAHQQRDRSDL